MVKPQLFTYLFEIIFESRPQAVLLGLLSELLGIYLRLYQFSMAVLRLMQ